MSIAPGGPSHTDGPPAPSVSTGISTAPVRADGVQLIGEAKGSGYREAPFLVRRADGQTIQLTRLLFLVLEGIDGERDAVDIAEYAGNRYGKLVSADNIQTLVEGQLLPLGLLRLADGSQPGVRKSDPLLGMRFRYTVTDPERTRKLTAPFAALFHPLIVAAVTVAFLASCWWVLMVKGLGSATHDAFANPGLLLLIFAITVLSAGFHEFGHAAAARRGGATPGAMGAGLYLVWPAFYTDVTDSYRLGRGGRLRTDLGGLYFNAIVAVAIMGIWWASGFDALLLVVLTQILQMVRQLLPLLRFDGYHILADATGVPDLFQRIKPTLPGPPAMALAQARTRSAGPEAMGPSGHHRLGPGHRAAAAGQPGADGPRPSAAAGHRVGEPRGPTGPARRQPRGRQLRGRRRPRPGDCRRRPSAAGHRLHAGAAGAPAGRGPLEEDPRQATAARHSRGRHRCRPAGLAWAWWPSPGTYRPVQPYERGTLVDATAAIYPALSGARTGSPAAKAGGPDGGAVAGRHGAAHPGQAAAQHGARAAAGCSSRRRDAGEPVRINPDPARPLPPSWVFPVRQAAGPEEDGNQALAVNTTDGSVTYDVAFALVWAEDGPVDTRNEAYAFASCADCAAVAVGFQVVLIMGQADVVVPENLSAAANYNCVRCLTYALASQLVLTLDGPLSTDGMATAHRTVAGDRGVRPHAAGRPPVRNPGADRAPTRNSSWSIIRNDPSASPGRTPGTGTTPITGVEADAQASAAGATTRVRTPDPMQPGAG